MDMFGGHYSAYQNRKTIFSLGPMQEGIPLAKGSGWHPALREITGMIRVPADEGDCCRVTQVDQKYSKG